MLTVDMVALRAFVFQCVSDEQDGRTSINDDVAADIAMRATLDFLAPLLRDAEGQAARMAAQDVCNIFKQMMHNQETDQ